MSWVWWVAVAWPLLAVALALVLSRSIRLADRRELGLGIGAPWSDEPIASSAAPQPSSPRDAV